MLHPFNFFEESYYGCFQLPQSPSCQYNLDLSGPLDPLDPPESNHHADRQPPIENQWPNLTLSPNPNPIQEDSPIKKLTKKAIAKNKKLKGKCSCKKNQCKNQYCECFKAGRLCSDQCGCRNCAHNKLFKIHCSCLMGETSDIMYDFKHNIHRR